MPGGVGHQLRANESGWGLSLVTAFGFHAHLVHDRRQADRLGTGLGSYRYQGAAPVVTRSLMGARAATAAGVYN